MSGGGGSSSSQSSSNSTTSQATTANTNAAQATAPVTTVLGSGGNVDITNNTTDMGAVDASLNAIGQVSTTAIASGVVNTANVLTANDDVTTKALNAVAQSENDAIASAQAETAATLQSESSLASSVTNTLSEENSTLIGSLDSSFSQLGQSFTQGLNFVSGQETALSTAETNAINTVATKNQSESALESQNLQSTLIELVGILAVAAVVTALVLKGKV